jgi:RNA polymerase sigma-54 factor
MRFSQRLEIRQGQSLVMTPQLLQAIKLLQLSSLELVSYIETELERNPLLERADDGGEAPAPAEAAADRGPTEGDWLADDIVPEQRALEDRLGTELGNVFEGERLPAAAEARPDPDTQGLSMTGWSGVGGAQREPGEAVNLEDFVSAQASLHDHLESQIAIAVQDPVDRLIGSALIDAIDEAGYLGEPPEAIALRLAVPPARVEAVLGVIHGLDPTGVGARNLSECLRLQLQEADRYDPAMQALVEHLDLLARRDFAALKKICGVDDEDLADMVAELRRLEPKPGLRFGGGPVQAVVPDVTIRASADGGWMVELNTDVLPRVLVNQVYAAKVSKSAKNEADKSYITDCLQTANWLTRSLEQRAKTILKVASEIARQQDGFLTYGVEHLRPLNLRTIADSIGMHESTVSRVTSNKFVATPRGIFEMKYFFTAAIPATRGGEAHSAEAVRFRIKQMIDAEPCGDVLSDDAIVARLRESGIEIARRTVAKYREALRIPSSVERRREKLAMSSRDRLEGAVGTVPAGR